MSLLGIFGKGPLSEKKITKISKLACNPYAQPDVRMREMNRLLSDGSPAALRGVLRRFASNASGQIADEDEKKYLEDALVDMGEVSLAPLKEYIRTEQQLTYALRAYKRIAGADAAVATFIEALEHHGPDDHRALDAKLQLVWQLAEDLEDPRVLPALVPFLDDFSDDVRWAVLDIIERAADEGRLTDELKAKVTQSLGEVVTGEDASLRIMGRTAEILAEREWNIPGEAESLHSHLEEDYFLDKKRFVRRRAKKGA